MNPEHPCPHVGATWDESEPCICGHDENEHTLAGCDSYTPTWPRLVRCPCTGFQLDGIASDKPISVDELAVTDFLNSISGGVGHIDFCPTCGVPRPCPTEEALGHD